MSQQQPANSTLEPTVRALQQLSPNSQQAVISLVRQLAEEPHFATWGLWGKHRIKRSP